MLYLSREAGQGKQERAGETKWEVREKVRLGTKNWGRGLEHRCLRMRGEKPKWRLGGWEVG